MAAEGCSHIYALPEDCITNALSLTSPKDVCRLSAVASTLRSASESDAVWERFLPSDYRDILLRAAGGTDRDSLLNRFHRKKDLYLHLCDHPVLIDGGRKSFSLDKLSGKKCFMLSARELFIVWGNTSHYWKWISFPESRFSEVAKLVSVCWFEIRAKINMKTLSPGTKYAAYLVFKTTRGTYGFHDISTDAFLVANEQKSKNCSVYLDPESAKRQRYQIVPRSSEPFPLFPQIQPHPLGGHNNEELNDENTVYQRRMYPRRRKDGWMEVELGESFVRGDESGVLEVTLMEVKRGNWKSGIIVEGIEIRPQQCTYH